MNDRLREAFREHIDEVRAWQPGSDPEPVLSALALVLVMDLAGELGTVERGHRTLLRERGAQALLAPAPEDADPEDWQGARDLARAGLDRMAGRPTRPAGDPLHPTDLTLARALRAEPDGLSAGSTAAHVARCESCLRRVRVLSMAEGTSLAVAAADGDIMRPPIEGRVVGHLPDLELEAVLFSDGRLALYAGSGAPVQLVAEGVATEQMLSGYWLGRVGLDRKKLHGRVHLGDRAVDWEIDLTAG